MASPFVLEFLYFGDVLSKENIEKYHLILDNLSLSWEYILVLIASVSFAQYAINHMRDKYAKDESSGEIEIHLREIEKILHNRDEYKKIKPELALEKLKHHLQSLRHIDDFRRMEMKPQGMIPPTSPMFPNM